MANSENKKEIKQEEVKDTKPKTKVINEEVKKEQPKQEKINKPVIDINLKVFRTEEDNLKLSGNVAANGCNAEIMAEAIKCIVNTIDDEKDRMMTMGMALEKLGFASSKEESKPKICKVSARDLFEVLNEILN